MHLVFIGRRPGYGIQAGDYIQDDQGRWVRVVQRSFTFECQDRNGNLVFVSRAPSEAMDVAMEAMD
jgi:hypothetical protein